MMLARTRPALPSGAGVIALRETGWQVKIDEPATRSGGAPEYGWRQSVRLLCRDER